MKDLCMERDPKCVDNGVFGDDLGDFVIWGYDTNMVARSGVESGYYYEGGKSIKRRPPPASANVGPMDGYSTEKTSSSGDQEPPPSFMSPPQITRQTKFESPARVRSEIKKKNEQFARVPVGSTQPGNLAVLSLDAEDGKSSNHSHKRRSHRLRSTSEHKVGISQQRRPPVAAKIEGDHQACRLNLRVHHPGRRHTSLSRSAHVPSRRDTLEAFFEDRQKQVPQNSSNRGQRVSTIRSSSGRGRPTRPSSARGGIRVERSIDRFAYNGPSQPDTSAAAETPLQRRLKVRLGTNKKLVQELNSSFLAFNMFLEEKETNEHATTLKFQTPVNTQPKTKPVTRRNKRVVKSCKNQQLGEELNSSFALFDMFIKEREVSHSNNGKPVCEGLLPLGE
jgi:hypothetical protein